jgi:hypothetical protein
VWFLDSGASRHYCKDRSLFSNYVRISGYPIETAEQGGSLIAIRRGDINLNTIDVAGEEHTILLNGAFHVPNLSSSLISLPTLDDRGYEIIIKKGRALVNSDTTNIMYGKKLVKSGLYQLSQTSGTAMQAKSDHDITLWHKRLGHLNANIIKKTANSGAVTGLSFKNSEPLLCEPCIYAKQKTESFNKTHEPRTTELLELVHMDLWGPTRIPTRSGEKYAFILVDDFSGMVNIHLLKQKSEALSRLKEYLEYAETQTGSRVKRLRCDNGGEFTSGTFREYIKERGIIVEYTNPDSPQQNPIAERMNGTLAQVVRALMFQAGLNDTYWGYSLLNRVVRSKRTKTASEVFLGLKPDLSKICEMYSYWIHS